MRLPIGQPLSLSKNHVIARSEATWQSPKDLDTHRPPLWGGWPSKARSGEVCPKGTVAPAGQRLFRHSVAMPRRATFPRGEGFLLQ